MVYVEEVDNNGEKSLGLTAVAIDLDPNNAPSLRYLERDEVDDDMSQYVERARESMDKVNDQYIDKIMEACKNNGPIAHFGFVDLAEQLQNAPHLLLANMCAAMLSGTAQVVYEGELAAATQTPSNK